MPFQLLTLGRLALVAPDRREDESLNKRRRKLVLLAVLALEGRPVPRDVLVEMFWGGQVEDRARHSLSDALSHLRRVLGAPAIRLGRHDVLLVEGALEMDAMALIEAARRRDDAAALAAWGGPFLHGVHIPDSASFEHWAHRQSRRLEDAFRGSCERSCAAMARQRRWVDCGEIAARWLDVAPLSADAALYRLNALKADGTPEADRRALEEYERLRARLRRELELAPHPSVAALATSIAARLDGHRAAQAVPAAPTAALPPAATSPSPAPRLPWSLRIAAAALLVGAVGAVGAAALLVERAAPPVSPTRVLVMPFEVRGRGEAAFLRAGMVDLLSVNLDGAGELRAVDPRAVVAAVDADGGRARHDAKAVARRFGAGLHVVGSVVTVGDRLRVTAALHGADGVRSRASAEGTTAQLFELVDRLSRELLSGYPTAGADRLVGLAAQTTSSLPALRSYLDGTASYRAGRFEAAFEAYERAARADSTFALAHYQLGHAALWAGTVSWDSVVGASRRAARHADRLGRRARLLVEANAAFRLGELDQAEQLYRLVVAAHPDNVEAWYQLGDVLFHGNAVRGRLAGEARAPFEQVLATEPANRAALTHLARIAAREGRARETASLVARALETLPEGQGSDLVALRAATLRDPRERLAARAELARAEDERLRVAAERVALFARDLEEAAVLATMLRDRARAPGFRALGALALSDLALARGRAAEARAQIAAAAGDVPVIAEQRLALLLLHPAAGATAGELATSRAALAAALGTSAAPAPLPHFAVYDGVHDAVRHYLIGAISVALGDTARARSSAEALDELDLPRRGDFAARLAESLRGHMYAARGEHEAAVAAFDRGRLVAPEGMLESAIGNQALERWARAESLRALGRHDDARRWYASLGEGTLDQLPWVGPAAARIREMDAAAR